MNALASQTKLISRTVPLTGSRRPAGGALRRPDTVQRILAAAEQAFAERGLAGARTDQIARAAQVNKALLYYYFKSKDELYGAVLDSLFREQRASIEAARAPSSLPHSQRPHQAAGLGFIAGFMEFAARHPNYVRLMQRQVMARGPHFDHIVETYWRPSFRRLVSAIEEGISSGEFRVVNPEQTVISLISMTVFYFSAAPVLREHLGGDPFSARAVAARREAVFDFLGHALFLPSSRKR
jgi:TetR/AcrR family transcriptional regulator